MGGQALSEAAAALVVLLVEEGPRHPVSGVVVAAAEKWSVVLMLARGWELAWGQATEAI